jgi:hypothetical protein
MVVRLPSFNMSQSQQSQFSDSFYDPELLQSDDTRHFFSSQHTVSSTPDSEFVLPPPRPRVPSTLAHVGPSFQKNWILYTNMSENDFVRWWLETEFGSKKEFQDTIHWDGKKTSSLWQHFDQVADKKTGRPKIMCKRCLAVLVHPSYRRAGNSPMKTHLKGGSCLKSNTTPKQQKGVDQMIRDSVSI